jgi:hypothetical protein
MAVKSEIILREEVKNKDRKFGSNKEYYPSYVELEDGRKVPALFTKHQIQEAMERAEKNPEDVPEEHQTFLESIFG